jgi:tRNA(Arg) A34 adenosine deaminase TadA
MESFMDKDSGPNRRDFIMTTAAAAGVAAGGATAAQALEANVCTPTPPDKLDAGFALQKPLQNNWCKELGAVVHVDLDVDAPELKNPLMQERHRIYCYLLMKLIVRFWNGNKNGPVGTYPQREAQLAEFQGADQATRLYKGDMNPKPDRDRPNWDRYLGHNIACIAVDGNGNIIDFDFNHNAFFRSSAEHAESRLVRRLFSLTDIFDSWKTGPRFDGKPHAASLGEVTLYTTLESCAQCSGVMSLAGVKQIIYLQNDFTAYKIGNLMYKLANRVERKNPDGSLMKDSKGETVTVPGAPVPIPANEVGIGEFALLNEANLKFAEKMTAGTEFFFKPSKDGKEDRDPAITSFLCTDAAYKLFADGGANLDKLFKLKLSAESDIYPYKDKNEIPGKPDRMLTNGECLEEANKFYDYVDAEGYRGSPHKL